MLDTLKQIMREDLNLGFADATILARNDDGTYNIKLKGGAVKDKVKSITDTIFSKNTTVTVVFPLGKRSHIRIIGRGPISTKSVKTVDI